VEVLAWGPCECVENALQVAGCRYILALGHSIGPPNFRRKEAHVV
jgi:hypothetical protein